MSEGKRELISALKKLLEELLEEHEEPKCPASDLSDFTVTSLFGLLSKKPDDDPIRIVVLDKGFVYIGKLRCGIDSLIIKNASCIRRWGTSKGLGELKAGPLANTILDPTGTVRAPMSSLVLVIEVEEDKWADKLK